MWISVFSCLLILLFIESSGLLFVYYLLFISHCLGLGDVSAPGTLFWDGSLWYYGMGRGRMGKVDLAWHGMEWRALRWT